jgi:hypothetical protein
VTTYWDKQQINITNNAGSDLVVTSFDQLPHGEWDTTPVAKIANGAKAEPAFITRSVNAAEVGPGPGKVVYTLSDGTTLTITFDMTFAVGQSTIASATAGGPRGGNYTVTLTCTEDSWHGQGRRYYGELTIAAGGAGPNTATCKQTN